MNPVLLKHLIESHSNDGYIKVYDSTAVLDLTASMIEQDPEIDFDCMVEQLRESDELTYFLKGMVRRSTVDSVLGHLDMELVVKNNLTETIDRLLRAG